jgi:hypothetical protein
MSSMLRSTCTISLFLIGSTTGCAGILNSLAESGPWGQMLRGAPTVQNPADTGEVDSTPVQDQGGNVEYRMISFSEQEGLCFAMKTGWSPESTEGAKFELEALHASTDDRDTSPKSHNASVRVTHTESEVRIVQEYDHGIVIEKPKTFYNTEAEMCFADAILPKKDTRYLLLYPAGPTLTGFQPYAVWQFPTHTTTTPSAQAAR